MKICSKIKPVTMHWIIYGLWFKRNIGVKSEIWTCNQLHQFGQIYKLLSNATVNIIEMDRNCVRWGQRVRIIVLLKFEDFVLQTGCLSNITSMSVSGLPTFLISVKNLNLLSSSIYKHLKAYLINHKQSLILGECGSQFISVLSNIFQF